MSEPVPPRPARRENVLTRKIGPIPTWGWIVIVGAVVITWAFYRNKQNKSVSDRSTTPASAIPDFVNQTYTTVMPPVQERPERDEDDEEAADRQTASLAGVAITLALLVVGLFLVRELHAASAMMTGGANCDLLVIRSF